MYSLYFANDLSGRLKLNYHTRSLSSLSVWDQIETKYKGGVGCYMTLEEIAKVMRITRERVRQIEKRALNKLRKPECSKILRNFYND